MNYSPVNSSKDYSPLLYYSQQMQYIFFHQIFKPLDSDSLEETWLNGHSKFSGFFIN